MIDGMLELVVAIASMELVEEERNTMALVVLVVDE